MLKIGDVVGYVDVGAPVESRFPGGSCCHEAWPVHWYAVLTKPGREDEVDVRLRDQSYRCFYPKRLVEIRIPGAARKREMVRRPLFPRYVFAGVPVSVMELGPMYFTRGVATVLHDATGPLRIKLGAMERLMGRADKSGVVEITEVPANHLFMEGQTVRFKPECVFSIFAEGMICRVDSNGYIKVLIRTGGNYREVDLHYSQLMPPE